MEIKDYSSNSLRSKGLLPTEKKEEKPKHQEKVVSGTVVKKKESVGHKLAEVFMPEDVNDVKDFVVWDVLFPSIRNAIGDSLMSAVGTLFPKTDVKKNYTQTSNVSYVSYSKTGNRVPATPRQSYSYDSIILSTRGEAEQVLQSLNDIIEQYGLASVGDLYDLVGIQGSYTDNKFGWTDLRRASADRVREGYLLRLPKAMPLD